MKYKQIIGSEEVQKREAFEYASKKCGISVTNIEATEYEEFKKAFVDWYFSGNWIEIC